MHQAIHLALELFQVCLVTVLLIVQRLFSGTQGDLQRSRKPIQSQAPWLLPPLPFYALGTSHSCPDDGPLGP